MPIIQLYPAVERVVQDTLAQPYIAGSGAMVLTAGGASFSANPTKFNVITAASYNQGPSEQTAVYQCTGQSGNILTGVSVLDGSSDQNFPAGSYVEIRLNAIDINSLNTLVLPLNAPSATGFVLTSTGPGTAPTWQVGGGGGGSGTVNSGTAGQPAVFPADGTTVAGSNTPLVATNVTAFGSPTTFDMSLSNNQQVTLTGNTTLALSNVTAGQRFTLNLIQDATGSRTVTWFGGITWAGVSAPTLQTAPNAVDTIVFWCRSPGVYQGYPTASTGGGGSGTVTNVSTGTGLTGGPITTTGAIAMATSTANTMAGYNNSGVFSVVTPRNNLTLSGGFLDAAGGSGGTPGGSSGQVQVNVSSSFGGAANLTIDTNGCTNLTPIANPGTPVAASIWTNSAEGKLVYAYAPAMLGTISSRLYKGVGFAAVANTTTQTSLLGSPGSSSGSLIIKANTLSVGDALEFGYFGAITLTATVQLSIVVKLGSTLILQSITGAVGFTTTMANGIFYSTSGSIRFAAVGSGGSAQGLLQGGATQSGASTGVNVYSGYGGSGVTGSLAPVATNVDLLFDIMVTWGVAAVGNSVQLNSFNLKLV